MVKYSYEIKKEIAIAYINVEGRYVYLKKKYNIMSQSSIEKWIKAYKAFGDERLKNSIKNKNTLFNKITLIFL